VGSVEQGIGQVPMPAPVSVGEGILWLSRRDAHDQRPSHGRDIYRHQARIYFFSPLLLRQPAQTQPCRRCGYEQLYVPA